MANTSDMNFFEKHVEKIILAVFVLLLAYVLIVWGLSSPRTVSVAGVPGESNESYPPTKVDSVLKKLSGDVQTKMEQSTKDIPKLPDYLDVMKEYRNATGVQKYISGAFGSPTLPVGVNETVRQQVPTSLAAISKSLPSLSKPVVWSGPEVTELNKDTAQELPVAHVAAVYPRADLVKLWNKLLSDARVPLHVVVLEVKGEYQELLPNGTWSKEMPVKTYTAPTTADKKLERPVVPPADKDMSKVFATLSALQENILQPQAPKIWIPGSGWVDWQVHLPRTEVADMSVEEPVDVSNPPAPSPTFAPAPMPYAPSPTFAPAPMPYAPRPPDRIGAPMATPRAPSGVRPVPSPVAPAAPAPIVTAGLPVVPTPPFARQVEEGKVLVAFHTNSLESGKTYRFRAQLVVVNPLTSLAPDTKKDDRRKVIDPKDTKVATISLPASEWSDPVSIPKTTQFFVTGGSDSVNEVNVVVFSQCLGQRVKKAYSLKIGQMIGKIENNIDVLNPMDKDKKIRAQADFSTGATAMSFDFNKRAFGKTGVELVYLDEQSRLKSRMAALDESSELYKQLGDEYKDNAKRLNAALQMK